MFTKSKLYLYVALLFSFSFLFSCSKDKDGQAVSTIVGTWTFSSGSANITINGKTLINFLTQDVGLSPTEAAVLAGLFASEFFDSSELQGTSLIFKADGTYEVRENGVLEDSGTYQLRNNNAILTITSGGDSQDFDVKQLTNNRLTIGFSETEQEDFNEDGVLDTVKVDIELTFTK